MIQDSTSGIQFIDICLGLIPATEGLIDRLVEDAKKDEKIEAKRQDEQAVGNIVDELVNRIKPEITKIDSKYGMLIGRDFKYNSYHESQEITTGETTKTFNYVIMEVLTPDNADGEKTEKIHNFVKAVSEIVKNTTDALNKKYDDKQIMSGMSDNKVHVAIKYSIKDKESKADNDTANTDK